MTRHSPLSEATADLAHYGRALILGPAAHRAATKEEIKTLLASTSLVKRMHVVYGSGEKRSYRLNDTGGIRPALDEGAFYIRGSYFFISEANKRAFFEWLATKKQTSLRRKYAG